MPTAWGLRGVAHERETVISIRRVLALLVGASLPLLMSTAAFAHAVVQPGNAPAGEATRFQVLIPHGCSEGEPPPAPGEEVLNTRLVSVEIPDGVTVDGAEDAPGFTTEVTDTEITWSDGDLGNGEPGEFYFTATLDGADGDSIPFNVYQECSDELAYRWTGDHDAATPAPVVTVGAEAAEGHDHGGDEEEGHDMEEMSEGEEMAMEEPSEGEDHAMDEMSEGEEMADGEAMDDMAEGEAAPTGSVATGAGGSDDSGSALPWVVGGGVIALLGAALLIRGRGNDAA